MCQNQTARLSIINKRLLLLPELRILPLETSRPSGPTTSSCPGPDYSNDKFWLKRHWLRLALAPSHDPYVHAPVQCFYFMIAILRMTTIAL